ncbi:MAG: nuclear transport factor 2 family protein [Pyrinomonadaceae bacterium]
MNETANTQTIRECYEKFGSGDIPGLLELVSDDIDWTVPEIENAPFAGSRHGRESVEEFFGLLAGAEDITHFEPLEYIAQGDRVVVLGRSTATVRSTGRHYSTEWVHVCTVKDGKMANFHEFFDNAAATRAFQKATTA